MELLLKTVGIDKHLQCSMETVVLMLNGSPVVKVPVINFQTFATDKIRYLETVIADAGNQRWKFYTYDASELGITESVEKWASWLIYRDLRAVVDGGDQDGTSVHDAVVAADDILDTEYSDALIDYWVSWIKNKQPAGTLSTDRLRTCNAIFPWICVARYNNVVGALVLYHDTKDALSDESERLMYQGGYKLFHSTRQRTKRPSPTIR
jgi:hypothetical protein